jgi:glyceraldehyde 3-phosphate dehydrogenase
MTIRVAINGFGRIGRLIYRHLVKDPLMEVVAVNDLADAKTLAHLLRYCSVYGRLEEDVEVDGDIIRVGERRTKALSFSEPPRNVWGDLGVDLVFECTGRYTKETSAEVHLDAGARWVVVSAPAKSADFMVIYGVNHGELDPEIHRIVSNGSCTTNCLAPVVQVLLDTFGIERGLLNTIHSVTNDQQLLDRTHKDLRRARAAFMSMIPTTTGAARALVKVFPELEGRVDGLSVRVPTNSVSLVDFTFTSERPFTHENLMDAFRESARGSLRGILDVCEAPLVSVDFCGSTFSAIVDAPATMVLGDRMAKVLAWYDNEFAYARRCVDVATIYRDFLDRARQPLRAIV